MLAVVALKFGNPGLIFVPVEGYAFRSPRNLYL